MDNIIIKAQFIQYNQMKKRRRKKGGIRHDKKIVFNAEKPNNMLKKTNYSRVYEDVPDISVHH